MDRITVNNTETVNNYPYGFNLRTTITYSIEFAKNKGFRGVTQTINPKTGLANKPKKGVYHDIMYIQNTNGFVTFKSIAFYELSKFNKVMEFLYNKYNLFTKEQRQYLYTRTLSYLKTEIYSLKIYCNVDTDKSLPLIQKAIDMTVKGLKEDKNTFGEIQLDHVAIEALKGSNFQPFRVVSYGV